MIAGWFLRAAPLPMIRKVRPFWLRSRRPRATIPVSISSSCPRRPTWEINALQRAATIVFQKSTREGFGLTVTEAMWKGKPVIGGATGGIIVQVIPGETGYTVSSPEGAAFYAKRLLNEPDRLAVMGRQAKEYVRHRFLITRHLQEYLAVIIQLCRGAR